MGVKFASFTMNAPYGPDLHILSEEQTLGMVCQRWQVLGGSLSLLKMVKAQLGCAY